MTEYQIPISESLTYFANQNELGWYYGRPKQIAGSPDRGLGQWAHAACEGDTYYRDRRAPSLTHTCRRQSPQGERR